MNTQRPLADLVPEILDHVRTKYDGQVIYNAKLLEIVDGQLLKYVQEDMMRELSPRAYLRSKDKIPPINILNKVIEKLSRIYDEEAKRDATSNAIDKTLLDFYVSSLDVDNKLAQINKLINLNKYAALEPYISEGIPALRVIPADQFLVWSDDENDPTNPTVFIKFMGSIKKTEKAVDSSGQALKNAKDVIRNVSVFHLYSDSEFLKVDADGQIYESIPNPYGQIPFIYCSNSPLKLLPTPDSDNLAMAILIPKSLASLNYAMEFASHSIVYGIDIDPQNLDSNPDAFWVINSVSGEGKTPSIGTIEPSVDSDKAVSLITTQLQMWLENKGLKTGTVGTPDASASGIAKIVDESDASAIRKSQKKLFRKIEAKLWKLISIMHNHWASNNLVPSQSRAFSKDFNPSVEFCSQKVEVNTSEVLKDLEVMFRLGLTNKELALKALYPAKSQEEIDLILEALNEAEPSEQQPKKQEIA